jgi:hypothetical protein
MVKEEGLNDCYAVIKQSTADSRACHGNTGAEKGKRKGTVCTLIHEINNRGAQYGSILIAQLKK